jgi:hypothetical protein
MARILTRSEGESAKVNARPTETSRMAGVAYLQDVRSDSVASLAGTPEQRNGRQMLRGRGRELPKSQSTVHPCYCRQARCGSRRAKVRASWPRAAHKVHTGREIKAWMPDCRHRPDRPDSSMQGSECADCARDWEEKFARYTTSPRGVSASSRFCCSALRELSWGWDPGGFLTCALLFMQRVDRLS